MRNRNGVLVLAGLCIASSVMPVAVASAATASRPAAAGTQGWASVPAAARAPIAKALARDDAAKMVAGLRPSTLAIDKQATIDDFGTTVAVSGNTVVVGAHGHTVGSNLSQGAVYVFTRPSTGWKNMPARRCTSRPAERSRDAGWRTSRLTH
jgi:FG-GAP repeat